MAYTTFYDDLIGKKFGRLTVLENTKKVDKDNRTIYKCQCDCGNIVEVVGKRIKSGATKSCGCAQRESVTKRNYKHGLATTRLHSIWTEMKRRCYDKTRKSYKHYGAKGIKVCDEWLNDKDGFVNFYNWAISKGYRDDHEPPLSIDRIDVNGNYCPENCRLATLQEQTCNKSTSIRTKDGYPIALWAIHHGLDPRKIREENKDASEIDIYDLHRRYFDYPLAPCTPDML